MTLNMHVAIAKYTPERVDKILNAIKAGNYPQTAARFAGVSKELFTYWMETYPDFREMVDDATAAAEVKNVAIVQLAAQKRWTAAAWWLERVAPDRWGKVDRVEMFLVNKQAEALVEELRAEGITITYDEVMKEREAMVRHSQNSLPAPKDSDDEPTEDTKEDAA